MLTGKQAFTGETVTDTLASLIKEDPDWKRLPAATPMRVRVLLQRCLQKDPKQRLRDIGDARISLDEVLSGAADPTVALQPRVQPSGRGCGLLRRLRASCSQQAVLVLCLNVEIFVRARQTLLVRFNSFSVLSATLNLGESCMQPIGTCSLSGGRRPAHLRASSDPTAIAYMSAARESAVTG
jgi:hypothetical protein